MTAQTAMPVTVASNIGDNRIYATAVTTAQLASLYQDGWCRIEDNSTGDNYTFLTFKGNVQVVNVAGEQAVAEKPWPLLTAADLKAGWRPGGYQPLALQEKSGRLYATMHPKGKEGSHKDPAKEIWGFDLATKKRVARVPGHHATVLAVTRGDEPKLYAVSTEKQTIAVFAASDKLKHLKTAGPFAETATQLDVQ